MAEDPRFILTKIIATVGPATWEPATLRRLIEEGARVFRVNFSHGNFEQYEAMLGAIRQVSEQSGEAVAVLGDICGPKIRVGRVVEGGVEVQPGDRVRFVREAVVGGAEGGPEATFATTLPEVLDDVDIGDRLFIDDGAVRTLVIEKSGAGAELELVCRATVGGIVRNAKGINLPDSALTLPSLTDYDRRCVEWAVEHELDFLALSFVRRAEDVRELKGLLGRGAGEGGPIPVIAKIEKPQALQELDAIIDASDALMVARGDLGVEMDLTEVPIIQKRLIGEAHARGKPAIVATQMLQSMIEAASPTRAEVSDVANAILDGADAVMLSGETAIGRYPVQAVHIMGRIALKLQQHWSDEALRLPPPPQRPREDRYRTAALAHGVSTIVRHLDAKLIAVWSQTGGGARYLSLIRPNIPIIGCSSNDRALRHMAALFGVTPVCVAQPDDVEAFLAQADVLLQERGWAQRGDPVVIVAGEPIGVAGVTNKLRIHYIGDACRLDSAGSHA